VAVARRRGKREKGRFSIIMGPQLKSKQSRTSRAI